MTLQQQLRQEVADVIQQLRAEVNEAINDRMDTMNSSSAALQRMTAKPAESKPYRISDFIPRNWEEGNEKGEFRSFMSDLHLLDASVVRPRRTDACHGGEYRHV